MRQTGITVARLEQEIPDDVGGTIYDVVAAGLGDVGRGCSRATTRRAIASRSSTSDAALRELDRLHHALDAAERVGDADARRDGARSTSASTRTPPFASASGGRKRQTLLARALVRQPDVLLLDEPTNHLDVDAIEWMEQFLIDRGTTLLFVTHDRAFLRRVATRIVELDRGRLVDWGADYDRYRRAQGGRARRRGARVGGVRQEAREGGGAGSAPAIQARRTRNEGRVRALEALRVERGARRERTGAVRLQAQEAERSGRLVVEARGRELRARRAADRARLHDDDHARRPRRHHRPERLRQDDAAPPPARRARARRGDDPARARASSSRTSTSCASSSIPSASVFDSIADGADFVDVGGARKHVLGYLQDFLFPPDRARTPVRALSGGERNRLLLARLFTRSFNLLVLDEPTNDLDIETLDLLEELLLEFAGTLLLVSHDRAFLDNVVDEHARARGRRPRRRVRRRLHRLGAAAAAAPVPSAAPRRSAPRPRRRRRASRRSAS